ncbi:coiled-coil domain-containing protein 183-like [Pezoporus flaviventris]|uniref:coiled-coil domain-containing protein 183-like n=1 Tax=Pezoporus flaviventris TaxID=889875 RepID=UPI002AB0F08F|nr:coiled-coil domain-containing protein 183-like [Pezoporus flaviventris]
MLLYQVEQRSRAKERLQRRLQQLQDVQRAEKQQQAQVVRTLEGNIEKMQTKVRAGQKVTALYVAVRDALRKELAHLPLHLDLLSETAELQHREVEDMELMASRGLRAARGAEERMVRTKTQVLAERELRLRTQAAQKEPRDGGWLKEAKERALKTQAKHDLRRDFLSLPAEDPVVAAKLEATKYQLQREAYVREKIEEAKDVVQCSRLWDIPIRLQAQQKSLLEMEQYLTRGLVEELRTRLQREEARLEQGRAQLLRSQETLLDFENALDNLFVRLRGITVPGQEHPVKAMAVDEKLRQCEQKLQYLVQRVADLPPSSHSEDDEVHGGSIPAALFGDPHRLSRVARAKPSSQLEDGGARGKSHGAAQAQVAPGSTFVKVRQLLEETLMADPRNRKVSLEDTGVGLQDDFDIPDNHSGLVLTREAIKKQGLDLIESKKKSKRK